MLFLLLSCFLFSGVVHFSALIDEMIEDSAADDDNGCHYKNPFGSFLRQAAFGIDGGWVKSKGILDFMRCSHGKSICDNRKIRGKIRYRNRKMRIGTFSTLIQIFLPIDDHVIIIGAAPGNRSIGNTIRYS